MQAWWLRDTVGSKVLNVRRLERARLSAILDSKGVIDLMGIAAFEGHLGGMEIVFLKGPVRGLRCSLLDEPWATVLVGLTAILRIITAHRRRAAHLV